MTSQLSLSSYLFLFSSIEMEQDETRYSIWVSFVEIHNESIYDLLDAVGSHKLGPMKKVPLKLADDQDGNVYIKDIIEVCNIMAIILLRFEIIPAYEIAYISQSHSHLHLTKIGFY